MSTSSRVAAVAAAVIASVALVAGCSSSSADPESSPSSSESTTQTLPPVIINVDQTEATAKVGDFLDILTADNDIAGTTVSTDRPDLVELTQAYEDGSAIFNPGGRVLAPGTAVITITNPDDSTRDVTLTITE